MSLKLFILAHLCMVRDQEESRFLVFGHYGGSHDQVDLQFGEPIIDFCIIKPFSSDLIFSAYSCL